MSDETPTPQEVISSQQPTSEKDEAVKERIRFNSEVVNHILTYSHSLKDDATEGTVVLGGVARAWLDESEADTTWSPRAQHSRTLWDSFEMADRDRQTKFLASANLEKPIYDKGNIAALEELLKEPAATAELGAPPPKPEEIRPREHTYEEKENVILGILKIGQTKTGNQIKEEWEVARDYNEAHDTAETLLKTGIHENWVSLDNKNPTPETFAAVYQKASSEQKKAFLGKVDFTKPPNENGPALKELTHKTKAAAPKSEAVPKVVAEAPMLPAEAVKVIPFEERVARVKSDPKYQDKYLQEVAKEAEKVRGRHEVQPSKLNKKDQTFLEDAVNTSVEVRKDLRKQAASLEKFFPGAVDHLAYLYVQTEKVVQLAQDLKGTRGKSLPDRDLREVSGRMREVCGKTIVQGWAGNDRQRNELIKRGDYLSLGKPIYFDTSLVRREVLTENEIVDWTKGRLGIYDQFWTQEIVYGADKNEASLGFDNGYTRFRFQVKFPDTDDLTFTKRVIAEGKETPELELKKAYYLFQTAKAQAHGICLHLSPEYLNALSEKTDKYLTTEQLPQGFEATKSAKKAIEECRKNPQDIEAAAWARRALFSDWFALSLTNSDYMKQHFPEELSFCEAIRKGAPIEKAAP